MVRKSAGPQPCAHVGTFVSPDSLGYKRLPWLVERARVSVSHICPVTERSLLNESTHVVACESGGAPAKGLGHNAAGNASGRYGGDRVPFLFLKGLENAPVVSQVWRECLCRESPLSPTSSQTRGWGSQTKGSIPIRSDVADGDFQRQAGMAFVKTSLLHVGYHWNAV